MTDPGDEHHDRDILHRLDVVWDGMGEMALEERREAADTIERLTAERDHARRLICNIVSTACSEWSEDVAKDRGWTYLFKEDGK